MNEFDEVGRDGEEKNGLQETKGIKDRRETIKFWGARG